jgi:hypothetical protein
VIPIEPGQIVTCRPTAAALWVTVRSAHDERWHVRATRVDQFGNHSIASRIVPADDITAVVRVAQKYEPKHVIEWQGTPHEIVADRGDVVALLPPTAHHPLLTARHVEVDKADLVLALFAQEEG